MVGNSASVAARGLAGGGGGGGGSGAGGTGRQLAFFAIVLVGAIALLVGGSLQLVGARSYHHHAQPDVKQAQQAQQAKATTLSWTKKQLVQPLPVHLQQDVRGSCVLPVDVPRMAEVKYICDVFEATGGWLHYR